MNSKKYLHSSLLLLSVLLFSCKNDLELNAPYKEYPSIYAVLNPQDDIQMIRINKVFLGEGDANVMAQVADSINYQPGEITITLDRYVSGVKASATPTGNKDQIVFRDSVIQTEPGSFNRTQRVYVTSDKLHVNGDYVLNVTNNKTKNVFTARASSLDAVKPTGFSPLCLPYYPVPPNNNNQGNTSVYIDYSAPQSTYYIRFYPNDAVIYQLTMRLHYIDSLNTGINQYNYVDFPFSRQNKSDAVYAGSQGPFITNTFKGSELYASVANSMAKSSLSTASITGRRMYKIQYIVLASTQDYLDYLEFSAPSLSIAQEKPLYSNFEGRKAIGIFAFRSRLSIEKEMESTFISQFALNSSTCKYRFFQVPQMIIPFCP